MPKLHYQDFIEPSAETFSVELKEPLASGPAFKGKLDIERMILRVGVAGVAVTGTFGTLMDIIAINLIQ